MPGPGPPGPATRRAFYCRRLDDRSFPPGSTGRAAGLRGRRGRRIAEATRSRYRARIGRLPDDAPRPGRTAPPRAWPASRSRHRPAADRMAPPAPGRQSASFPEDSECQRLERLEGAEAPGDVAAQLQRERPWRRSTPSRPSGLRALRPRAARRPPGPRGPPRRRRGSLPRTRPGAPRHADRGAVPGGRPPPPPPPGDREDTWPRHRPAIRPSFRRSAGAWADGACRNAIAPRPTP